MGRFILSLKLYMYIYIFYLRDLRLTALNNVQLIILGFRFHTGSIYLLSIKSSHGIETITVLYIDSSSKKPQKQLQSNRFKQPGFCIYLLGKE
jgi:hypothetical protein